MKRTLGVWQAASLAVGTMIGASIFSVFGLGAQIAGTDLTLVFVLSGLVALLVAQSYARLGSQIVSNAGPMEFILRGFGDGVLAGSLSILCWLTYVASIALFAKGFAGYLVPLVSLPETATSTRLVEAGVVMAFTSLNFLGTGAVGRAEFAIVLVKLGVLGTFVFLGVWTISPSQIRPELGTSEGQSILEGSALFFLSYMGFGLVTNASENMKDPVRDVPRAIYASILIVTAVYVSVAAVTLGNLPVARIVEAQDFALAEAAKPFLGDAGYLLVSLGALFSIASALNATLYGGANIAYALARDGELPEAFERKLWFKGTEGLYLTAGLGVALAVLFDINGVASITSAIYMVIYLFVLLSHYRLVDRYGGSRPLIVLGLAAVLVAFVVLLSYQWQTDRAALYVTLIGFALAVAIEVVYRSQRSRTLIRREVSALERAVDAVPRVGAHPTRGDRDGGDRPS